MSDGLPAYPGRRAPGCPFDPPPEYAAWRREGGLRRAAWNGHPVWVVSRYEDVRAAAIDPGVSADVAALLPRFHRDGEPPQVFALMDDPEHGRIRRMMLRDFTHRRVTALRPEIERAAREFLTGMLDAGPPADLVEAYALPIPSLVISLLLGVPYADHAFFQRVSSTAVSTVSSLADKQDAAAALFGYMADLVARKQQEPGDDLMSRLAERVTAGDLSRDTAAMSGFVLLQAGHETTANMIALGVLTLLRHPEQLAAVRDADDPAAVAGAVEELLRYLTIVHDLVARVARTDVTLGGRRVAAGAGLLLSLAAANRDPAAFDRPDVLDVGRDAGGHLAFGHGVHQCLGQALARAELEIALPLLLRAMPGLCLALPFEQVPFKHDMSIYGVHALPVDW